MTVPLTATGRITWNYTVNGQAHKARVFTKAPSLVGGAYYLDSRTTPASLIWEDCADKLTDAMTEIMGTGYTAGQAVLEHRVGSLWSTLAVHSIPTVTRSANAQPATETTLVLRDTAFHLVKVILLEGLETPPQHSVDPAGGDATMDLLIGAFLPTAPNAEDPYNWQVGRSNLFLNTTPFVAFTVTLNRKIRRRRGLA